MTAPPTLPVIAMRATPPLRTASTRRARWS